MSTIAPKILRIDGSTRHNGSVSRDLTDLAVEVLQEQFGVAHITQRDMRSGIGNISSAWRTASLTPNETRSTEDRAVLAQSEALINEFVVADFLLIAVPIYNFNIPALTNSMKQKRSFASFRFRPKSRGPPEFVKRTFRIYPFLGLESLIMINKAYDMMRNINTLVNEGEDGPIAKDEEMEVKIETEIELKGVKKPTFLFF